VINYKLPKILHILTKSGLCQQEAQLSQTDHAMRYDS